MSIGESRRPGFAARGSRPFVNGTETMDRAPGLPAGGKGEFWVRTGGIVAAIKGIGGFSRKPAAVLGEARGPIRKCGRALWTGAGGPARPQLPDRAAFLPVPDRAFGGGQD